MFQIALVAFLAYQVGRSAPRVCSAGCSGATGPTELEDPADLPYAWPPNVLAEARQLAAAGARLFWEKVGNEIRVMILDPRTSDAALVSWAVPTVAPDVDADEEEEAAALNLGGTWPRSSGGPAYAQSYPGTDAPAGGDVIDYPY